MDQSTFEQVRGYVNHQEWQQFFAEKVKLQDYEIQRNIFSSGLVERIKDSKLGDLLELYDALGEAIYAYLNIGQNSFLESAMIGIPYCKQKLDREAAKEFLYLVGMFKLADLSFTSKIAENAGQKSPEGNANIFSNEAKKLFKDNGSEIGAYCWLINKIVQEYGGSELRFGFERVEIIAKENPLEKIINGWRVVPVEVNKNEIGSSRFPLSGKAKTQYAPKYHLKLADRVVDGKEKIQRVFDPSYNPAGKYSEFFKYLAGVR